METQQSPKGSVWKQLAGVAIAGLFLWLAFRGCDFAQLWTYIKGVNPLFVCLILLSAVTSHFLRALRWVTLLGPLSERKVGLFNSFCATLVGYAVNVVIPRGGEVARLVSISRSEKLPWMGVLSTMFIDRLLDIALLVLLLGFTLMAFPTSASNNMPWLVPGGVSLSISTVIGLLMLPHMGKIIKWLVGLDAIRTRIPERFMESINRLADQFETGTRSLSNPVAYPTIAGLSLAIWFFYWLNFYLMVWAFHLENVVNPLQCLIVFTIGSAGVLVPTPGNVGSFHLLVSQGLTLVSGVNKDLALAFASTLHILCFVVATCVPAAICVAIQSARGTREMQSGPEEKIAVASDSNAFANSPAADEPSGS